MNSMDSYTAEKLVAGKQAELRAAAAREALLEGDQISTRALSAIRIAASLARRAATQIQSGGARAAAAFGWAGRG